MRREVGSWDLTSALVRSSKTGTPNFRKSHNFQAAEIGYLVSGDSIPASVYSSSAFKICLSFGRKIEGEKAGEIESSPY